MSGLLLDTNAFLWLLSGSPRLGRHARTLIAEANPVYGSAVCVLEVTIKQMLGRLQIPESPAQAAHRAGLVELPFRAQHAAALAEFPELARHDPFDRMLLAQAKVDGLDLLTSDRLLLGLGLAWVSDAGD